MNEYRFRLIVSGSFSDELTNDELLNAMFTGFCYAEADLADLPQSTQRILRLQRTAKNLLSDHR